MGKNISFIGAGNVAWHLAPALENAGHVVREVYSRSTKNASKLVDRLYQAEVKQDLDFSESNSEIFIISISDDAIDDVVQEIVLPEDAIIVHTSGAKSIGILGYTASEFIGVFYPLQTFSKSKKVNFEDIPICIEAENSETEKALKKLAKTISKNVVTIDSADRKTLHVAAVFACNFTNHCMAIAEDILKANEMNFDLIKPLIIETLNKSFELGPHSAQTGPAKRHDFETLDAHLEYLGNDERLAELYRLFSQHIVDSHPRS